MADEDNATATELATAMDEINKSIHDLLSLKLTIPLGNPNLKHVHTNQFLWYDLPSEFKLEYLKTIFDSMNSTHNRFSTYEEGKWYIEGLTIHNDGKKFTMDLELNPFASSLTSYRDEYQSFVKAYQDWENQVTSEDGTAGIKSTSNSSLAGGQGETIDNLVREICGNETNELEKAKLIDRWLNQNLTYKRYCCGKYGTDAEKAYNNRGALNCGDTAMLTVAMMRSAGLTADVVWAPGHFWTRIKIGGKEYFSDQTSSSRAWNTVWRGMKYSSVKGTWSGCEAYAC